MPKISVFPQIIKLIPRIEFEAIVARYDGDKNVRKLDCWTWLGALLFSQLSGHDSVRALEKVFDLGNRDVRRLGFNPVCRSTLSDANSSRPMEILQDIYGLCLQRYHHHDKSLKDLASFVYLLDSTFIKLCLGLCPWAYYRRSDQKTGRVKYAGVKLHTAIDLTGHIPEFVVIREGTESDNHDLTVARKSFHFPPKSLVVFDRGYWSLDYFNQLNQSEVGFVTRPKNKRLQYRVAASFPVNRTLGLKCDQHIYFNSPHTKGLYKGKLRRISFKDPETGKRLVFITNRLDLPAKTICDLYKARWQVELFFKTLKQNLKIKKFLGLNKNAVFAQIFTALIAYVLLMYLRRQTRSTISMPELMAVVGTFILTKLNLFEVLSDQPKTTRHPPTTAPQLSLFSTA